MIMRYRDMICVLVLFLGGCKKYLTIPLPVDVIAGSGAFENNAAASSVLTGIYTGLLATHSGGAAVFQGSEGIGCYTGLYTDEQTNAPVTLFNSFNLPFYTDALNSGIPGPYWSALYNQIYEVNLAIEGLTPTHLSMRNQLLGEAYFLRALMHFYLTNLYGAIPIAVVSDIQTNNLLARSPQADVYKQIVADLGQAADLLDDHYRDLNGAMTTDRGRPDKMGVMALLARVYLYTQDWADAESLADSVIGDADYQLAPPLQVFLAGSQETIWGLAPLPPQYSVADVVGYFIPPGVAPDSAGVGSYLSNELVGAFEPGDARFASWVGVSTVAASGPRPAATYYFAYKYKAGGQLAAPVEYLSMLRLGEVYLVRAEARARQGDIAGAAADLNVVRSRAGLGGTTASSQADMLGAILHERQVELFAEHGHRLFDLRRMGQLDAVMNVVAPVKGGTWSSYKEWWPILSTDIQIDPNLVQTPGY
jgi:hypothetical protein